MPSPARHLPRPGSGCRGFTVIELMLAVLVLAALVGLAIPSYNGWQDKLKVKKAQEDIIAMSVVIDAYLADTGALPADLAAIGRAGLLDPWGMPYQYQELASLKGKGKARKDHSLVPLNSDYDLYSMGPDRSSVGPLTAKASRDDILRARNGQFVGPASMF